MLSLFFKSRVVISSAFLFIRLNSFCQSQLFKFESLRVSTEININKRIKSEVLIQANDDTYSLLYYQNNNKLFLKNLNLQNDAEVMKSEILYRKDRNLKERKFICYAINKNKIAIVTWDGVALFTKSKKDYRKNTFIPLKVSPIQILLTDSFLFCCHYYFSHPKQETRICYIDKYDLKGKLIKTIEFPVPYPEYTSYLPFSPFSFSNKTILVAIQTPYIFYEVNFNLQIVNKVIHPTLNWINPPGSFKRTLHNGFFNYKMLDSIAYYKISRLEGVNFINDSSLFIKRRERIIDNMNFMNYYFDIFKRKSNGQWEFSQSIKEDNTPLQMNRKTDSTFCLIFSDNCYHFFNKNYLIKLELSAPINPMGFTLKEWMIEKEAWLKKNDPIPVISKYKINEIY